MALLRVCVTPEHSSHMSSQEHLEPKPKEKLRGQGERHMCALAAASQPPFRSLNPKASLPQMTLIAVTV